MIAGAAALFAGALSMAAGEYVAVNSQYDTEQADLRGESEEPRTDAIGEQVGLAGGRLSIIATLVDARLSSLDRWARSGGSRRFADGAQKAIREAPNAGDTGHADGAALSDRPAALIEIAASPTLRFLVRLGADEPRAHP